MKILFLTHYDNMYGANRALYKLMKGLKEAYGAEIILVIPAQGEMTKEAARLGIRFEVCGVTQWQAVYREPVSFLVKQAKRKKQIARELDHLTELFREEQIDIIHSNSSVIGTGAMLAKRLGCRHIWHIREFSREHFHMEYFYPAKFVRACYEDADCLVAISDAVKENYREKYPKANVVRVYDGVTLDGDAITKEAGLSVEKMGTEERKARGLEQESSSPAGKARGLEPETGSPAEKAVCGGKNRPLRFCYVGYLFPMKRQMDLIEACHELKEKKFTGFELYLVGSGKPEYEKKLKARMEKYGLANVKLTGYRDDVQELLNTMDVGVIASEYEGFGLVTVEYMLHSLPVIGRNSGGTGEIVLDGETGCLYDDMEGLVEAMKFMLTQEERRRQMGALGRQRALRYFSEEENIRCMMNLYGMLLAEK